MKKKNLFLTLIFILSFAFSVNAESCNAVFSAKFIEEIRGIFRIIQIAAPSLLLLLTSIDFAKVVFSNDKDGMDKAKNNFLKRVVSTLIIFFAPYIVMLVFDLVNMTTGCVPNFK